MPKNNSHSHSQNSSHQGHHGNGDHAAHSPERFKKKFFLSLVLTIPVLALSPLIQDFFNFSLTFPGDRLLLFLLSSVLFFYGGWPFLSGAKDEIQQRSPGMMTLISLAIGVAYLYSSAVVFGLAGKVFFWELATLIDIMLLGHWIEMRSVMGASQALEKLSALLPNTAHRLKEKQTEEVPVDQLKEGDIVLIKPGEKIPTDGQVVKGESFINESMLTGEAKPVSKSPSDQVIGGSVNQDGSLQVKVAGVGEDSYLNQVINLVKQAQTSKSKTQALADKAAFWLTLIAISAGVLTLAGWLLAGRDLPFAIERTATVLVITCPHALGLAIPLVVAISTTLSAQNGLLIRNRTAFENSRKISTVVFDKTGTLTQGTFGVKKIFSLKSSYPEKEVLRLFAGLEQNSEHPIAQAILQEAQERKIEVPQVDDFQAIKGKGVQGVVKNRSIVAASPGYIEELNLEIPEELREVEGTVVFLVIKEKEEGKKEGKEEKKASNVLAGALQLTDTIRPESFRAVKTLREEGLKIWMLTGDNQSSAQSVSEKLQLDGFFAGVLPDQKQDKIKELQQKGEFVAMVGDGINDAPALAQADVGIAIGSGTDIAAETADIILVNSNPQDIASLILFGKATHRKMLQNLAWATGYNVFAIPLAAGALAPWGILLSPAVGAVLMSLSTVIVAVNAQLLRIGQGANNSSDSSNSKESQH